MSRNNIRRFAAWSLLMAALVPAGSRADTDQPDKTPETTPVPMPQPADGFFVVPDEIWMTLSEDADGHFRKAAEAIAAGQTKSAGREIRKGAAFLKLEANRAGASDRPVILGAARDLDGLASRLESGDGAGPGPFLKLFARAHYVTARHLWNRAREEWARHDDAAFGRDLQAAVIHLEQGLNWGEIKRPRESVEAIHQAAELADRVTENLGWAVGPVDSTLRIIQAEIDTLGSGVAR